MRIGAFDPRLRASDAPIGVMVEPTSRCNLKCVFCPLTIGDSSTAAAVAYIDVDRLAPQLWMAVEAGLDQVVLAGFGEPSLHPRFVELLKLINASGVTLSYSTNGIALQPVVAEALPSLDKLVAINVSVDVGDPDEYRRIRGGNLGRVWRNVKALSRIEGYFSVNVSAILTRSNAPHLRALVSSAGASGARSMTFQSLYDTSEALRSEHILSDREASELVDNAEAEAMSMGLQVTTTVPDRRRLERDDPDAAVSAYFDDPRRQGLSRNCNAAWEWLFVDAKGQVFPCCNTAALNTAQIGDLGEESLLSIWNGKKMRRFRRALASADTCPDVCAKCSIPPAGFPLSLSLAATLVGKPVWRDGRIRVRFRNTGMTAWEGRNRPCIGTAEPRDRLSGAVASGWLSKNRAAMMNEEKVSPGEIATFEFAVAPSFDPGEAFALVIDGLHWIPRTSFRVEPASQRRLPQERDIFAATLIGVPALDQGSVKVRFRNSGMATWAGKQRPCIGTAGPRDRVSAAATSGWLSENRAAVMNEEMVAPGEIASFDFEVGRLADLQHEAFELVIDGVLWIPKTWFSIGGGSAKKRSGWSRLGRRLISALPSG